VEAPAFFWSKRHPLGLLLWPLSLLFGTLAGVRRLLFRLGLLRRHRVGVPVIVVGNISVGGTGKTPLVVWLARHLERRGLRPGIVTRGYGGGATRWPQQVRGDSDPTAVGDEPVLLARRTGCPVAAGPDRVAAARALLQFHDCDVVISDDGLQHYALARDLEIVVVDGVRRLGNGRLLPAGPLREGAWRLRRADLVVVNGEGGPGEYSARMRPEQVRNLRGAAPRSLNDFAGRRVHAVAGIGNPERFFAMLEKAGLEVQRHPFPDHHRFTASDLDFGDLDPVLMTEKDAVKCEAFSQPDHWYVPIGLRPEAAFIHRLNGLVEERIHGQEATRHSGVSDLQG